MDSAPHDWTVLPYQRPSVTIAEFSDASGEPITYGSRYWGEANIEPPSEAYETCTHPERFDPVAVVMQSLVDYLTVAYLVDRVDTTVEGVTETQLSPRSGGGTPLTFTSGAGNLPGAVRVRGGWRFHGLWPDCGCDACDDNVEDLIEELANTVLTIVEGGMSEWRTGPEPTHHLNYDEDMNPIGDDHIPWMVHVELDGRIDHASGSVGGGWSRGEPEPVELPTEPYRWPAWQIRDQGRIHRPILGP